mmetsp:Transcript_23356/g.30496  ORF Transcript_23356/g.30496 Transcript_23356/m.30496 type:complete len:222 (+) Transcript_23356:224-889(+)
MKAESLKLGAFLFLWYVFNIGYNIYNKKVLLAFPFPWTVACLQLGIGLLYILPVWSLNIRPAPSLTFEDIKKIGPVAAFHTMGHVATVCALGGGSVGFVHIIKAAEPFFSTILTAFFTGAFQPFLVNLALVPVVGGVCIASVSELSFTWPTFLSAMSSNSFFFDESYFLQESNDKGDEGAKESRCCKLVCSSDTDFISRTSSFCSCNGRTSPDCSIQQSNF